MNTDYTLNHLFPTTVFQTNIGRSFTKKEMKLVLEHETKTRDNKFNVTSIDDSILEKNEMKNLKEFCVQSLNNYFYNVLKITDKTEIYMTQSWLNYTGKNQGHHGHSHPNSLVSGVFYFQTDADDKIYFSDRNKPNIFSPLEFEMTGVTYSNSKSWWLPAITGTLYLFPSDLWHYVEFKQSEAKRISLSFNTFIKGQIGSYFNLTNLVI